MSESSTYSRSVVIRRAPEEVFLWHERPGALERLTPPWEKVRVLSRTGGIRDGARVALRVGFGPVSLRWDLEHRDYDTGRRFRDVQVRGPFRRWEHTHLFEPVDGGRSCRLTDEINYDLRGRSVAESWIVRRLDRLFRYRHAVTRADLEETPSARPLRILIGGASGLLGKALTARLGTRGHAVAHLVRGRQDEGNGDVFWDPGAGHLSSAGLEGFDAVVHLGGVNLASGWWTRNRKRAIRNSRVWSTRLLVDGLADCRHRPGVFVCASAVGYYGSREGDPVDESAGPGEGFLAEVCREWEDAAAKAESAGIRVVNARFGVVLSPAGGALAKMLPPFQLGLGGRLGTGRQGLSWVSIDDAVRALEHVILREEVRGPVNMTAPAAVSNAGFTAELARVVRRPAVLPVPAWVLRTILGEMADEMLLGGVRCRPEKLLSTGFEFRHPELGPALAFVLGRIPHSASGGS